MKIIIRIFLPCILLICSVVPVLAQSSGPETGLAVTQSAPNSPNQVDFSGCNRVDVASINPDFEQKVVELVNQNRWDNGNLPPLKRNSLLDLASRYQAKDMLDDNYFEHDTYDINGNGELTRVCLFNDRINIWYPLTGSMTYGENIAGGFWSPETAVEAWMGSDGHRKNILNADFREIGVGYYTGGIWVQDFIVKNSVLPLIINREAAQTSTNKVKLYIYGSSYEFPTMRFKNDGQDWSGWMPFSNDADWTLRPEGGLRTVSVELRRNNLTYVSASDNIILSSTNALGGVPEQLTFIYNRTTKKWSPSAVTIQPINIGGSTPLTWNVNTPCGWISLNHLNGVSPNNSLQVSINVNTNINGTYDDVLTISVQNPQDTLDSPKTIQVHVAVVANFTPKVFMPFTTR